MKRIFVITLVAIGFFQAHAGSLNVVHIGPEGELEFEAKAGKFRQKFTLPQFGNTGGFLVAPKQSAKIEARTDHPVEVKLPASDKSRIAVFHREGDSFAWRIVESKPSEGKFTLRFVNLTKDPANIILRKKELTIPASGDLLAPTPGRSFKMGDGGKVTVPPSDEPCAMIAFIYTHEGKLHMHFMSDT